jgi:hypothetical protein
MTVASSSSKAWPAGPASGSGDPASSTCRVGGATFGCCSPRTTYLTAMAAALGSATIGSWKAACFGDSEGDVIGIAQRMHPSWRSVLHSESGVGGDQCGSAEDNFQAICVGRARGLSEAVPGNAGRPLRHSMATRQREQTSDAVVASSPFTCSGLVSGAVPTNAPRIPNAARCRRHRAGRS